ncbi:hypothetical protein ACFL27_27620 [candidate division CSSED10-310 bacterium]|uniref:Uncharacterized protein n=1 Tax=candidate division CSSED10-310 bacterium TaxID=2855610 RepID=A0ABV6Z697_UNCC1
MKDKKTDTFLIRGWPLKADRIRLTFSAQALNKPYQISVAEITIFALPWKDAAWILGNLAWLTLLALIVGLIYRQALRDACPETDL